MHTENIYKSVRVPLAELSVESIFIAQLENYFYQPYKKLNETEVYSFTTGKVLSVHKFSLVFFSCRM